MTDGPRQPAPLIFKCDGVLVCTDREGVELPDFSGVAYHQDEDVYVITTVDGGLRGYRMLGALGYQEALKEAKVAERQTSFDW